MHKRLLGLDYGQRRIGVAISDPFGWTAQGLTVIDRRYEQRDFEIICGLIHEHEIKEVVVGLPLHMNAKIGITGNSCIVFARKLNHLVDLPVHLWDERLSSKHAERTLLEADVSRKKRRQVVDKLAAVLILQNYLDANNMS